MDLLEERDRGGRKFVDRCEGDTGKQRIILSCSGRASKWTRGNSSLDTKGIFYRSLASRHGCDSPSVPARTYRMSGFKYRFDNVHCLTKAEFNLLSRYNAFIFHSFPCDRSGSSIDVSFCCPIDCFDTLLFAYAVRASHRFRRRKDVWSFHLVRLRKP